jgi:hypothetical protein
MFEAMKRALEKNATATKQSNPPPREVNETPPWGTPSERDFEMLDPAIPGRAIGGHTNWGHFLQPRLNVAGLNVLEIGSRAVNSNGVFRQAFSNAKYIGFDFHAGQNVDVVGDAHKLSEYFEEEYFDGVVSSAVFEHLAMPWIVAEEISKLLKIGGLVFVETHFSYSMHEMPWNFFQFSHKGLEALFNESLGFDVIESGVSNPLIGRFSQAADSYLIGQPVRNLYCHAGYLGRKARPQTKQGSGPFDWRSALATVYSNTEYPKNTSRFDG